MEIYCKQFFKIEEIHIFSASNLYTYSLCTLTTKYARVSIFHWEEWMFEPSIETMLKLLGIDTEVELTIVGVAVITGA